MKLTPEKKALAIIRARLNGHSWEKIASKYGISVSYAKSQVDWLLYRAANITDLEASRRKFREYKKHEKKKLEEKWAVIRKGLNRSIAETKQHANNIIKLFK
jgi:hypothetical protein